VPQSLTLLGIETSCDDTAVGVVRARRDGSRLSDPEILANSVYTQTEDHAAYGGVVPEIAARSHVQRLDRTIRLAMDTAGIGFGDLDAIAVTAGPGLIGGVLVGLTTAKAMAITHRLPLCPVNHLEGHALSVRMTAPVAFPYLLLLISGGHTQLIDVRGHGDYRRLGTTIDDAAGEAFDKTAKLLGLGQPGGPRIEAIAKTGDPERFAFPLPLHKREGCDFSFSGLKTAARLAVEKLMASDRLTDQDIADLAASFQHAAATHLAARTRRAMTIVEDRPDAGPGGNRLVAAGGVAANQWVRQALETAGQEAAWTLTVPPPKYCTDNGAMIAWAGLEALANNAGMAFDTALALAPRARWPLAARSDSQAPVGGGKKGPKA